MITSQDVGDSAVHGKRPDGAFTELLRSAKDDRGKVSEKLDFLSLLPALLGFFSLHVLPRA
jgi:hypothetical protein